MAVSAGACGRLSRSRREKTWACTLAARVRDRPAVSTAARTVGAQVPGTTEAAGPAPPISALAASAVAAGRIPAVTAAAAERNIGVVRAAAAALVPASAEAPAMLAHSVTAAAEVPAGSAPDPVPASAAQAGEAATTVAVAAAGAAAIRSVARLEKCDRQRHNSF